MIISTGLEKCSKMDGIKGRAPKENRMRKPRIAWWLADFLNPNRVREQYY